MVTVVTPIQNAKNQIDFCRSVNGEGSVGGESYCLTLSHDLLL